LRVQFWALRQAAGLFAVLLRNAAAIPNAFLLLAVLSYYQNKLQRSFQEKLEL
jgi:hypothetical protein